MSDVQRVPAIQVRYGDSHVFVELEGGGKTMVPFWILRDEQTGHHELENMWETHTELGRGEHENAFRYFPVRSHKGGSRGQPSPFVPIDVIRKRRGWRG